VAETVVLLHGLAGTRRAWDGVTALLEGERYRPLALDLRGHGRARAARPIGFAEVVADVLAAAPARFALCGYSMGGRIALHVALAAPLRVSRLVLVSTTAGIEDPDERAARREADERLAQEIERGSIDDFVARWRAQPLFAGDPGWVRDRAAEDQRRNEPRALAEALRGLAPGVMEPVWGRLGELAMPVDVLVGERDSKFVALGRRLAAAVRRGRVVAVPGVGHALPVEAPQALADALARALD
jgi:2-succinyl-6-hydroxy-2,4-cyclohexadiene-1-carboxylate synthase